MSIIVNQKFHFSTPFLLGYKKFLLPILNNDGTSAWPDVFPVDKIDNLRKTVGEHHFLAQMMLQFTPPEHIRLDPGKIQLYDSEFDYISAKIGNWAVTGVALYWDPSLGHKNTDSSVCALIFRDDKSHNIFLHDIMYMIVPTECPQPLTYQCDLVLDFLNKYKLHRLAVEINGLGNALPEILSDKIASRGGGITIQKITNHTKKESRILNTFEPLLGAGRMFAHTRIQKTPFMSEMLGWSPIGGIGHDDGLDAVAGAINILPIPIRPHGNVMRNYTANTNFKI
jgi:predicted phage terminase large subunit-like protein